MPYPFWNVELGYGPLMALIAVIHVFVSHFAIGGGLYLVIAERSARAAEDEARLGFVRKLSKFFVLTTVVFGALTGVMIWFIIGLLNPKATEALIHNFVWGWAIEWTFFAIEILAAILYYYGWKRLSAKRHLQIGWIYFVAAWLSLVVINGIITFMLTPGTWIESGAFWEGFFNPTYWPSVVYRTGVCILLAGLFALAVAARVKDEALKTRVVRYNAVWAVAGLLIAGAAWFWYRSAIPADVMQIASERLSIPATSLGLLQISSYVLLGIVVVLGFLVPRSWNLGAAVVLMALGLFWFGSFEWFRESARKPYVIYDYMYGNGVRVDDVDAYRASGFLEQVEFRSGDDGADLFRYACRHCHRTNGYNPVLPAFDHTDATYVKNAILGLHEMKGKMPPFAGNAEEAQVLADWLWAQADQTPLPDAGLGSAVYEQRCGRCHVIGGYNDKTPNLVDYEAEELEELLLDEEGLEGMPPFTGTEAERKALLEFLAPYFAKGGE